MFWFFLFGLAGSLLGFAIAGLVRSPSYVQRGRVLLRQEGPDEYRVQFVTRYQTTPQLNLFPKKNLDSELISEHWYHTQKYTLLATEVTVAGFVVTLTPNPYKNNKKGEEFVYRVPGDAYFDWRAEGLVDSKFDGRSVWLKLSIPQRVFSLAGALFLVGIAADIAGLLSFGLQLTSRH